MAPSPNRSRRFLLDMHIPDWDDRFLSQYEPVAYANLVADTGVDSVMVYAQSHVGVTYWPSTTGKRHPALGASDWFGETIAALHQRGIEATAYYSVIFNNYAAEEHPDWATVNAAPLAFGPLPDARYGQVCPNNRGYRAFAEKQIREIASGYEIDGFFLDMAFWPTVCLCPACQARSNSELGRPIPAVVDWNDRDWIAFQRAREHWLFEFTSIMTRAILDARPGIRVYHNSAIILGNWVRGYSFDMTELCSFLGGDFYGGRREQALIGRLLTRMTRERPAEFMTTVRSHLVDHEEVRSIDELEMIALSAIAKGAAIRYIDAIDPVGTVNPAMYRALTGVFERVGRYDDVIGGELVCDVAVYVSDYCKLSVSDNGDSLLDASARGSVPEHIWAAAGAVAALESRHYSVDVITRMNLAALDTARVLIVPDARYLGTEETNAIREFVAGGGNLYASGSTSLGSSGGGDSGKDRFALEDLLGCVYEGNESAGVVYVVPKQARLVAAIAPNRMATRGPEHARGVAMPIVQAGDDSDVLATLAFPYGYPCTESTKPGQWSSIHSDPPWHHTSLPAVVRHQFRKGTVIYSSCDLESQPAGSAGARLFGALIDELHDGPHLAELGAPPWVSVCLFHQADRNRYVVTLLAYPQDVPVQPVEAVECRLQLPVSRVLTVTLRETGESLEFTHESGGQLALCIPVIDKLAVLIVDYTASS